jgi:hypothetical protein
MTLEKAFYYFFAISGYAPDDAINQYGAIDLYGKSFDASNYERAMADEFERSRYRERIRARIADEVRKIDFNEKFTFVAQATLGEYSFGSHSFPFVWDLFPEYRICIGPRSYTGGCAFLDMSVFRVQEAVNGNDFNWSVPMSETDASAFVKSRSMYGAGKVDRRITVRITYSVVNKRLTFSPFIYSVEIYDDESLTKKLSALPKINSLGPSTVEEWRLATVAAQTATKEIGKYRYITGFQKEGLFNPSFPYFGTITLTDIGITWCVEQPDGSCQMRGSFRFFDSPAATLYRSNEKTYGGEKNLFFFHWSKTNSHEGVLEAFETEQERDRFFADLTRAFQEWKTKYAAFQFAAGNLEIGP